MAANEMQVGDTFTAEQLPPELQKVLTELNATPPSQPQDTTDPVDLMTPEELVRMAVETDGFTPVSHADANRDRYETDPAYREKLAKFSQALTQRGFELEDIDLVKGAKALGHMAVGLGKWGRKVASSIGKATGAEAVTPIGKAVQTLSPIGAIGGIVRPIEKLAGVKETPQEVEKRFQESAKESTEALASFELGATGAVDMVGTAGKKLWRILPGTATPKDWTPEEAEADLNNKILKLREQQAQASGKGAATEALVGDALKELGIEADPKEIAQLSDPITFFAIPGGFKLAGWTGGKLVQLSKVPLSRSQAVRAVMALEAAKETAKAANRAAAHAARAVPEAEAAVGAMPEELLAGATKAQPTLGMQAVTAANRAQDAANQAALAAQKAGAGVQAAETALTELPAGQQALLTGVQQFNRARNLAGAASEAVGAGVDRAAEVATGGAMIGAGYGLGFINKLAKLPGIFTKIVRLPSSKTAGPNLRAAGASLVEGESFTPWAALASSGVKGAIGTGTGAAKGLVTGDIPFMALVSESSDETANFPLFGAAMHAGRAGVSEARRTIYSQYQTKAATDAAMNITKAPGANAALNAATVNAAEGAKPEQVRRFAAWRMAAATMGTELYWASPKAGGTEVSPYQAAINAELPPHLREAAKNTPGFITEFNADGSRRTKPLIVLSDPGAAGHEFAHAGQQLFGNDGMARVRDLVFEEYGPQWNQRGNTYVGRFLGRDVVAKYALNGESWREAWLDYTQPGWRETTKSNADFAKKIMEMDLMLNDEISAEIFQFIGDNQGPELMQDPGLPGKLARSMAKIMQAFGQEAFPDYAATEGQGVPLTFGVTERFGEAWKETAAGQKRDVVSKDIRTGKQPKVTPRGAPQGTPEAEAAPSTATSADKDKVIKWLNEKAAPTDATRKEAVEASLRAMETGEPVRISYFGAKGEPGGSPESMRPDRRAQIEASRGAVSADRQLVTKDFWPESVNLTASGPQFQGWSVDNFTANVTKFGNWLKDANNRGIPLPAEVAGLLTEYGIDPAKGLTPENWSAILADATQFSHNQRAGATGSGLPVVMPKEGIPGYSKPAVTGAAVTPLNQTRADFINYMLGLPLSGKPGKAPVIRDATKVPLDVAGMEIAAKTGAAAGLPGRVQPPVFPRKTYGEGGKASAEKAAQLGIEGVSPQEVNPFRGAVERTSKAEGIAPPDLIEVSQRLNFKEIGGFEGRPEGAPDVRANVLTTKAGFQAPPTQLEAAKNKVFQEVHPAVKDGKRWRTFFRGSPGNLKKSPDTPFVVKTGDSIYITKDNFQGEQGPGVNLLVRNPLFISEKGWIPEGVAKTFFDESGLNQIPYRVPLTYEGKLPGKTFIREVNAALRSLEENGAEVPSWATLAKRAGYDAIFVDGKPDAPKFILTEPDQVLHAGESIKAPSAFDYYDEPVAKQVRADIEALSDPNMSSADFVKAVDSLVRRTTLSSGAENIGKFQAPKFADEITRIRGSKSGAEIDPSGKLGGTGVAYRLAAQVEGGRDIAELNAAREYHLGEFNKARAAKDYNLAAMEGTKAQIFREAVEAAQNLGSGAGALPDAPLAPNKAHTEAGRALEAQGWKFSETKNKFREDGSFSEITITDPATGQDGAISYHTKGKEAFVDFVRAPFKGKGIGTALYREMLSRLQADGVTVLGGAAVAPEPISIRRKLLGEPEVRKGNEAVFSKKPVEEVSAIGNENWAHVKNLIPPNVLFQAPKKGFKGETVEKAAVKFSDDKIFLGDSHYEAIIRGQNFYDSKGIKFNDQPQPVDEGWSTSKRPLVSREEAYQVGKKSGQVDEAALLEWMEEQGLDTSMGTGEWLESSAFNETKKPPGTKFQAPQETLPLTHPEKSPIKFDENIKGGKISVPASSYKDAVQTGTNPYVRRSANSPDSTNPDNSNRQLMVQFASDLIYGAGKAEATGQDPIAGNYYDKLYSGARKGYARLEDFWEIPQWMGFGAHIFKNADVYVVRDMAQAKKFIKEAGYDRVLMSALDVNKSLVNELVDGYTGKVDIGGYVKPEEVTTAPNIKWHKDFQSLAKDAGVEYRNGVDYRHFAGSDVIPRLTMSSGCKHKCAFCSTEKDLVPTPPEVVTQQAEAIAELGAKLVYLNDKTFGQASNYRDLEQVNEIMREKVPGFGGFVVQTTAAQMNKIDTAWLVRSGIRFVELGIESYNDPILKEMRKPATESLMDRAADKLREAGVALIPNIIIGFPKETPQTYARTLEWLKKNADNISHANIYNLALYENTELGKKLKLGDTEADFNENVLEKSWMTDPQVHRTFAGELYGLATSMLEGKPESTKFQAPEPPANVGKISEMKELWEETPRVEKAGTVVAAAPETKESRLQIEPSDAPIRERKVQFQASKEDRAIKQAAIRLSTGEIFTGNIHAEAHEKAWEAGALKEGVSGVRTEDGFVTNDGEFLDVEAALERAQSLKQLTAQDVKKIARDFDIEDRLESRTFEQFRRDAQFAAPKNKKENAFKMPGGGGTGFKKAWILPNGTPVQLGSKWHHEWLKDNAEEVSKRWGIPLKRIQEGDQTSERVEALKAGFVRLNLEASTGRLGIELREADLRKHRNAIYDFVEANSSAIDNIDVTMFTGNAEQVSKSDSLHVFRLDDKEKADNIPFISKDPSGESRFQAPKATEFDLGFEEPKKDDFRPTVAPKVWSEMTQAQKREHFPEAAVPRSASDKTSLDIKEAPLYKKAANEQEAVELYADRLVKFAEEYKDTPEYKAGAKWYEELVPLLKKVYGKDARIMAEFLAATSPQTNPEVNFAYAHDALLSYRTGRFDKQISKFQEGLEKVADGSWESYYNRDYKAGRVTLKDPAETPTAETFLAHWIVKHDLQPRSPHGTLYGANSDAVLKVAARTWMRDNAGPKTENFVKNMTGESDEATIDVWASRTMEWAGQEGFNERWRTLPEQKLKISDPDFAFSQKAFRAAAERLKMKPSALQGALWFAEKHRWAKNGWSRLNLGSFVDEIRTKRPMVESRWRQRVEAAEQRAGAKKTKAGTQLEILPK